jgi:glycosyltransferase involved in cell wall biosynthesis
MVEVLDTDLKSKESFILVTPVKNEEDNLPNLIESIVSQQLRPDAWIIVDDHSEDKSSEIIKDAKDKYPWIFSLRLNNNSEYNLEEHYSIVCRFGFDYAKKIEPNFKYIGLSDADMIYPNNYFFQLISYLNSNLEHGLVCGDLLILNSEDRCHRVSNSNIFSSSISGTGRVWRRKAFEESGGYLITKSPDSVSNVKLLLKGWKLKRLSDVVYYQTRETGNKFNIFKGYFNRGKRAYYLNSNILSVIGTVLIILFVSKEKYAIKKIIGYLFGYFHSFIHREQKIDDKEVKKYIGSYRRVLNNYLKYFANRL